MTLSALINAGFTATYSETRGGMLRQSQLTLFIAVRSSDVQTALNVITDSCNEIESIRQGYGLQADHGASHGKRRRASRKKLGGGVHLDVGQIPGGVKR